MSFWVGTWLHDAPDKEYDADGKRAVVKHLCFAPLETQIWYESKDHQYSYEIHFIEGIQAGDLFVDFISRSKMLEVINSEIALCEKYNQTELVSLFQTEKEQMDERNKQ